MRSVILLKLREGISCLGGIRSAEPECAAVNFVAAGLGLGGNDARNCFTEFRSVVLQGDFRFGHGVEIWIHNENAQNRILIIDTVKFKGSSAKVLPLREDLLATLWILCSSVAPSSQLL